MLLQLPVVCAVIGRWDGGVNGGQVVAIDHVQQSWRRLGSGSMRILVFAIALAVGAHHSDDVRANTELERAVEILRASDEEWRREDASYRAALKDGGQIGRASCRERVCQYV